MFFLLQISYIKEQDPTSIIIGAGILIAFILFLVISNRTTSSAPVRRGRRTPVKGKGAQPVRYSRFTFRRNAERLGLTKIEIKTLDNLIRKYHVPNPYALLTNSRQLDHVLGRALSDTEIEVTSSQVKESQKLTLFRIKQKIERGSQTKQVVTGTRQMKLGQNIVLSPDSGGRYPSRVTSNLQDTLGTLIPTDNQGNQVRWRKGTGIDVFFWKSNGQGFSFVTKVAGYNVIRGVSSLFLQHSAHVKQAQQRKYRRKHLDKPTYFYPVRIITTGTGKNQVRKAFIEEERGALGTIIDVSAGGCAVKSSYPLPGNTLIKVEFETDRSTPVVIFGKVKSIRKVRPIGGIMHIRYTKVTKKNMNNINAFVYNLDTGRLKI